MSQTPSWGKGRCSQLDWGAPKGALLPSVPTASPPRAESLEKVPAYMERRLCFLVMFGRFAPWCCERARTQSYSSCYHLQVLPGHQALATHFADHQQPPRDLVWQSRDWEPGLPDYKATSLPTTPPVSPPCEYSLPSSQRLVTHFPAMESLK